MKTSESIKSIAAAMVAIQGEIKGMTPDAKNPFFKSNYITLDGILEYVRPILTKHQVWLFQNASGDGEFIEVVTRIVHSSGEWIETDSLKMKPTKNDPQQMGSAITYAKRYQLASLIGVSSEVDDDGNKATYGSNEPKNNAINNKKLTDAQVKRLFAIAATHNVTAEQVKAAALKAYKKTEIADLSKKEYDELCKRLEKAGEK